MQYLESVIESGLFSELKKSDYMDAFEQLKVSGRSYQPGEAVFFEGDLIDKFCIVRDGSIRSEKTYLNGEVHIVDMFDEGSVFALNPGSLQIGEKLHQTVVSYLVSVFRCQKAIGTGKPCLSRSGSADDDDIESFSDIVIAL